MPKTSNFKQLLSHQFKSYRRSAFWHRSVIINILIGIFILYLIFSLALFGIVINKVLAAAYPDKNVIKIFTRFLFYFLLFDFSFRFFVQKIPVLEIEPYLHLPIKRSKLFHFILFKSTLSLFNYLPLIVLIPFAVKVIVPEYSVMFAIIWLLIFYCLLLTNNFFVFTFKKYFVQSPLRVLSLFLLLIVLLYLDVKDIFPISKYFTLGVMKSAEYPFILVVPLLLVKGAYSFAYRLLKRSSYLGDFKNATRKRKAGSADFSFLKRQGAVGELLYLETRLIWLNKRPRAFLTFGLLFLFYGFFVYGNPKLVHNYFYLIGMGVFLTGMFIFQYGQLIFEWESSYFDRLFTLNISIDMLFQEKYYLLSFSSLMLFIITLPFALFNYEIAFINLAALLFNAGFNVFLILFLGRYNKKRITLSKSALMNYEGTNFIHFIIFIPTVGLPYLLFIPFYFLDVPRVGIAVIAAVGFIGLLLKEQILKLLSRQYTKIKYEVLSGFRQG